MFDAYVYYLMLEISNKQPEKGIFGKLKPSIYTNADLKKIGDAFHETIYFMDYERNDKQLIKEFTEPTEDNLYILSAKENFYILIAHNKRNLSLIEVTDSKSVNKSEIERIFKKP